MIADDAVGIGRRGDVLEQPPQPLDRVAAPRLRGPTGRRLAARVDQRHGAAVARVHQHEVVRVLGAPPRRSVQVQPREEIGLRVGLQQHPDAAVEFGIVELARRDPDGFRQPVAGLRGRAAEREQADAGACEIAEDFDRRRIRGPGHAAVRLAVDKQRRHAAMPLDLGHRAAHRALLDGRLGPRRFELHAGFAQLQIDHRLSAPGVFRDPQRDTVQIDPLTWPDFRQRRRQQQREVHERLPAAAQNQAGVVFGAGLVEREADGRLDGLPGDPALGYLDRVHRGHRRIGPEDFDPLHVHLVFTAGLDPECDDGEERKREIQLAVCVPRPRRGLPRFARELDPPPVAALRQRDRRNGPFGPARVADFGGELDGFTGIANQHADLAERPLDGFPQKQIVERDALRGEPPRQRRRRPNRGQFAHRELAFQPLLVPRRIPSADAGPIEQNFRLLGPRRQGGHDDDHEGKSMFRIHASIVTQLRP